MRNLFSFEAWEATKELGQQTITAVEEKHNIFSFFEELILTSRHSQMEWLVDSLKPIKLN